MSLFNDIEIDGPFSGHPSNKNVLSTVWEVEHITGQKIFLTGQKKKQPIICSTYAAKNITYELEYSH